MLGVRSLGLVVGGWLNACRKIGHPSTLILLALFALAGCHFAPPPDPNDPANIEINDIVAIQQNLKNSWDGLAERIAMLQITDEQAHDILAEYTKSKVVPRIDLKTVKPKRAREYIQVYKTARDWNGLKRAAQIAVKVADNPDRRVNDRLSLAMAEANLGDQKAAMADVRETFKEPSGVKAPILYAMIYDIVPPLEKKGDQVELAKLLEEAIAQHDSVTVDPKSQGGKDFLLAKSTQMNNAWRKVIELYREGGREDLAQAAITRMGQQMSHRRLI